MYKGNYMVKTGVITKENYRMFSTLMLTEIVEAFEESSMVIAYGVVVNDTAVGVIAGMFSDEYFQIKSLYVAPAYRRNGYGTLLLNELLQLFKDEHIPMEISFTVTKPEHESLLFFLDKADFIRKEDYYDNMFFSDVEELSQNPIFLKKVDDACVPFSQITPKLFYGLELQYKRQEKFIPIPEGGFFGKNVDPDLSCACVMSGEIKAYIVVEKKDGIIIISSMWSKLPQAAMVVLRAVGTKILNKYPPHTQIAFRTLNMASYSLAKKILPSIKPVSYTFRRYY